MHGAARFDTNRYESNSAAVTLCRVHTAAVVLLVQVEDSQT